MGPAEPGLSGLFMSSTAVAYFLLFPAASRYLPLLRLAAGGEGNDVINPLAKNFSPTTFTITFFFLAKGWRRKERIRWEGTSQGKVIRKRNRKAFPCLGLTLFILFFPSIPSSLHLSTPPPAEQYSCNKNPEPAGEGGDGGQRWCGVRLSLTFTSRF